MHSYAPLRRLLYILPSSAQYFSSLERFSIQFPNNKRSLLLFNSPYILIPYSTHESSILPLLLTHSPTVFIFYNFPFQHSSTLSPTFKTCSFLFTPLSVLWLGNISPTLKTHFILPTLNVTFPLHFFIIFLHFLYLILRLFLLLLY